MIASHVYRDLTIASLSTIEAVFDAAAGSPDPSSGQSTLWAFVGRLRMFLDGDLVTTRRADIEVLVDPQRLTVAEAVWVRIGATRARPLAEAASSAAERGLAMAATLTGSDDEAIVGAMVDEVARIARACAAAIS